MAATQNEQSVAEIACFANLDGAGKRHPQNSVIAAQVFQAFWEKVNFAKPVRHLPPVRLAESDACRVKKTMSTSSDTFN